MTRRAGTTGLRVWAVAAVAAAIGACAPAMHQGSPVEYLDRDTAVTFTVVASPLIFCRVRPEVAARVRDYATVAAASMDRNGHIQYVLLIYLWSTVDPRNEPDAAGPAPDLTLLADDRRFALHPLADSAQPLPPMDRPAVRHVVAAMYPIDLPALRFLIGARYLSLLRGEGTQAAHFDLWRDERSPLADFVRSAQ